MKRKLNRKERRMFAARGIAIPEDGCMPAEMMEPRMEKPKIPQLPRKSEEVQQEYMATCSLLGEKQFQKACLEGAIEQLLQRIDALVSEAKRSAEYEASKNPGLPPDPDGTATTNPEAEAPKCGTDAPAGGGFAGGKLVDAAGNPIEFKSEGTEDGPKGESDPAAN